MEKISSNGVVFSSSSSQILDLTKSLSVKVDTSTNNNFKDYVKGNNTNSEKYTNVKDNRFDKKEEKDKINDDKKEIGKKTSYKDEDKKLREDNVVKKENANVKDDVKKDSKLDNTKKIDEKASSIKDEKNVYEDIKDKKEVKEDVNLVSMIYILVNNNKEDIQNIKETVENISPKQAQDILEQLDNMDNIPQDLKGKLSEIFTTLSKGEKIDLSKDIELINPENIGNIKDTKLSPDTKELFKKSIEKATEKSENVVQNSLRENTGMVSINRELDNLKNELNFGQKSSNQTENVSLPNDDIENIDSIYTGENITNVKIMGMNAKVMSNISRASMSNEQIQNFSKIIDEMRLAFKDDKTTLNIKLQPETLGKLSIKINSENGVFNASFFVESEKAKQAIEQQLHVLRQSLLEQGINIQDINVEVGQGNEDLNYHQNIMEAINFSKKGSSRFSLEDDEFSNIINPYIANDDLFNDLI